MTNPTDQSWRVRTFWHVFSSLTGLYRASKSLISGIGLGLLDRRATDELDTQSYVSDRIYRDPRYVELGLFRWESNVVRGHFEQCRRIAVVGAGSGREVLGLFRAGFDATGFECNQSLVDIGRWILAEQGVEGALHPLPRNTPPPTEEGLYDAVVVGYGVLSHIRGRDSRQAFIRQVSDTVHGDGPILMSFALRPETATRRLRATHRIGRFFSSVFGGEDVEFGDVLRPAFFHLFTEAEVRDELEASGLELVDFGVFDYGHAVARRRREANATPEE